MPQTYTTKDAAQHAEKFCAENPGWQMICDIENSDVFYKTWEELSGAEKAPWLERYGSVAAKDAWELGARKPCKIPFGFISGTGVFYEQITDVPEFHNSMMIFKTGITQSTE